MWSDFSLKILSAAIVFRVHPFLVKNHRELPFLAIAHYGHTTFGMLEKKCAVKTPQRYYGHNIMDIKKKSTHIRPLLMLLKK